MSPTKRKKVTPVAEPVVETPTLFDNAATPAPVEQPSPIEIVNTPTPEEVVVATPQPSEPSMLVKPLKLKKKHRPIPYALISLIFIVIALLGSSVYYIGWVHQLDLPQPDDLTLVVSPNDYVLSTNYPSDTSLTVLSDNDLDTFYATSIAPNRMVRFEIDFTSERTINQLVIAPRTDAWTMGLIRSVRLFANVDGEMLLLNEYSQLTQAVHVFTFTAVETTHLELLVTEFEGSYVSLSEVAVYERDVLREQVAAVLVDDEPRPGLTQAEIDRLVIASQSHPMKDLFLATLTRAQQRMLGSGGAFYPLTGLPSAVAEQSRMRTLYLMNSLEPTGLYATPGETITLNYDNLANNTELSLCFSRYYGFHENAYDCHPITQSPSTFIAPTTYLGPMYLQFRAPFDAHMRMEISGGTAFPIYREGASVALYEDDLVTYHESDIALPDPSILGSGITLGAKLDITELVSDKVMITLPMMAAYQAYVNDSKHTAEVTLNQWDSQLEAMIGLLGFDDTVGMNHTPYLRENLRAMTSSALTHVQDRFVSLNINPTLYTKVLLEPSVAFSEDLITELSSRYSLDAYNNFYAMDNAMVQLLVDYQLYLLGEPYLMESPEILNKLFSDLYQDDLDFGSLTSVEQMAIHWQLSQYYGFDWYGQAMRTVRQSSHLMNHATLEANSSDWIMIVSTVVNQDLSLFFGRYNIPLNSATRQSLAALDPAPDVLTYVDADYQQLTPQGVAFYHHASISSITQVGNSYRLTISMDESIAPQILGYFIYRDGEEIGFTASSTYIDNTAQIGDLHRYSVRPLTRQGKLLSASTLTPLRNLWYPRDFEFLSICNGLFCTSPDAYGSLFDHQPTTWETTSNDTHTLIVEMSQSQRFYGVSLTLPELDAINNINQFTISTSDDGILWSNPLFTATFDQNDDTLERGIYFSSPVQTRFIRIEVTGYNGQGIRLEELNFFVESQNLTVLITLLVVLILGGLSAAGYFWIPQLLKKRAAKVNKLV